MCKVSKEVRQTRIFLSEIGKLGVSCQRTQRRQCFTLISPHGRLQDADMKRKDAKRRIPHMRQLWGISSSGRASALQAEGDGFESRILHLTQFKILIRTLSSVGESIRLITGRSRVRVPEGPLFMGIWRNWQTR